jgi:hypothetical protein
LKLPRRQFLHLGASAAALPALSHIASAQTYPTRPVRMLMHPELEHLPDYNIKYIKCPPQRPLLAQSGHYHRA